jgi:hypothetical protein
MAMGDRIGGGRREFFWRSELNFRST